MKQERTITIGMNKIIYSFLIVFCLVAIAIFISKKFIVSANTEYSIEGYYMKGIQQEDYELIEMFSNNIIVDDTKPKIRMVQLIKDATGFIDVDENDEIDNLTGIYLNVEENLEKALINWTTSMNISKIKSQYDIVLMAPSGEQYKLSSSLHDISQQGNLIFEQGDIDVTSIVKKEGEGWYYVNICNFDITAYEKSVCEWKIFMIQTK